MIARPRQIAYHEAGHAVIGWRLRTRVRRASIRPENDGSAGHVLMVKFRKGWDPDLLDEYVVRRRLEPQIISLFAGVIAERRFTGRRHNWTGAGYDLHEAAGLVLHCVGGNPGPVFTKYSAWLWETAKERVEGHWPQIEAVAAALLESETMTGQQIRDVILASYGLQPWVAPAVAAMLSAAIDKRLPWSPA